MRVRVAVAAAVAAAAAAWSDIYRMDDWKTRTKYVQTNQFDSLMSNDSEHTIFSALSLNRATFSSRPFVVLYGFHIYLWLLGGYQPENRHRIA